LFRIRMSRNFGMKMLTMTNLSTECLIQLTKLGYDATPFNQILKQNAKREMRLRLGKVTVADVLAAQPVTTNLLKFMRRSIKMRGVSNLLSFIASMTQKLTLSDISDESKNYLAKAGITTACLRIKSKWTAGGKRGNSTYPCAAHEAPTFAPFAPTHRFTKQRTHSMQSSDFTFSAPRAR